MSKTLIISDNKILNRLYTVNLEVYLGTSVMVVENLELAKAIIIAGNNFDLIVTVNMINGQDTASTLAQFCNEQKYQTPIIIIGNPIKEISNAIIVQSSYHLQNLLRQSAKILKVSAQDMVVLDLPDYFPIDLDVVNFLQIAPCQFFLHIKKNGEENEFTLMAKKGTVISELLSTFVKEGLEKIYVLKEDRLIVINEISSKLINQIKNAQKLNPREKASVLKGGFDFIAQDFCQSPEAAAEIMILANECTAIMEQVAKDVPSLKSLLNILITDKSGHIYVHTMLATYVANHILKKIAWGGESQIEKINFVLFFHDIVLAPLYIKYPHLKYEEDLLFTDELSDKEKETVLNHARLAAELVSTYKKAPMGVDLLIKQHHGMTSGVGFAIEYKDDISPLSKIVLISEAFVDEYIRERSAKNNQFDIKNIISLLNEKFRKSSYKKIIETIESIRL